MDANFLKRDAENPATARRRVVVIGGGITGLAAAHRLVELDRSLDVTLLEASGRLGGVLETCPRDGFLIEAGADNFITTVPWAIDLCRRIGMEGDLIETNAQNRCAMVVRRGRLRKLPQGFVVMAPGRVWPIVTTPILSPLGKLRLALEPFIPRRRSEEDESLASFVTRRLGRETYERLVQPLVGGIYTGDPEKLSAQATMERFCDMERDHGSLVRAMWRQAAKSRSAPAGSGARYSMFVAPRGGMSSMVDAIAGRLPSGVVQRNAPVRRLAARPGGGWSVDYGPADATSRIDCDAVLLTTPAPATSKLLAPIDGEMAQLLAEIPHASCSTVTLAYRRDQIAHPLDGFGFVVPAIENRRILSCSFSSVKYQGRAPDGQVLLRVFIGGECQAALARLPENELEAIATEELGQLLGIQGRPKFTFCARRLDAMPQYYVGHAARMARFALRLEDHSGLFLAGNAFGGVGIPHCIASGESAAARLAAHCASGR